LISPSLAPNVTSEFHPGFLCLEPACADLDLCLVSYDVRARATAHAGAKFLDFASLDSSMD
jgi:hypothetical protein